MTRRGVALVVAAVSCWLLGRLLGIPELYVLAAAAGVTVLSGVVAMAVAGASVAARRRLRMRRLPAGGRARVVVDLRSESRLPVPVLLVSDAVDEGLGDQGEQGGAGRHAARFVVPGLVRGASVSASYEVTGRVRGRYELGPLTLRMRDPLGLVERVRRYTSTDTVIVYPRVTRLPGAWALGRHHGSGTSRVRRLLDSGAEFHTMREYVDGDDMRQVHWPSTARHGELMIRQHEESFDTSATVVCDTSAAVHHGHGEHSSLERAVEAVASVVWHLDDLGYRVRFATEADAGLPHVTSRDACLDRLAELRPTTGRSLAPVLRSLRTAEAGGLLVAVLAAAGRRRDGADDALLTGVLQAGRAYGARVGIVLDTGEPGSDLRAGQMRDLLSAAGWRAAVWADGGSLADVWTEALRSTGGPRASAIRAAATPSTGATARSAATVGGGG